MVVETMHSFSVRRTFSSGRITLLAVLLALPWIQPFAPGPSANVVPWLASAACALAVFLLLPGAPVQRKVLIATTLVALYVFLGPGTGAIDRSAFAGGCALVLLCFSIGRRAAADEALVDAIATAWLVAAAISALLALLQYFDVASALQPWVAAAKPGEAVGNLRQRNQLASLTGIGLAAALWLAARGGPRRAVLTGVAIVLLAVADAATTSRTGLLEWVVILALVAFWQGPGGARSVKLVALGLVAYAAATWLLPILLEHVTGAAADSMLGRLEANLGCSSRRVLWADVLQLIPLHPWAGWGWGELDYAHYIHLYGAMPRFCDILDNAHNLPLHVAVELGVPAALLLCAGILAGLLRARPWSERDGARQLAWLVLSVLALHSLVEYPIWYGPFQIALGLALGLLAGRRMARAATGDAVAATPAGSAPVLSPVARAVVAVPLLALLAYAGWDYDRVSQIYLDPDQRWPQWREHTLLDIRRSWLFANQASFAELTLADVTRANAAWVETTSDRMLHYSPEPRVIERLVESATLLGHDEEAVLHLARFRAAFPVEYAKWRAEHGLLPSAARRPGVVGAGDR